jgi:hypothetical protein
MRDTQPAEYTCEPEIEPEPEEIWHREPDPPFEPSVLQLIRELAQAQDLRSAIRGSK